MDSLTISQVLQMIGTGGLILGCTWRLSSQISAMSTKLDLHCQADAAKFKEHDDVLDEIAPRTVRLVKARS